MFGGGRGVHCVAGRCLTERLWRVQEILEIEQIMDEDTGLELTEDNIETVLDEIRPYLVGEHC